MIDTEILEEIYEEHFFEIVALALLLVLIITIRVLQPNLRSLNLKMPAASPQTVCPIPFNSSSGRLITGR